MMAKRHASFTIEDASGRQYTFRDIGDVKFSGLQEGNNEAIPVMERDLFVGYVEGEEKPISGSFTCILRAEPLTSSAVETLLDVLLGTGAAGANTVTTNPGGFGPKCFTGIYAVRRGGAGGEVRFSQVRLVADYDESTTPVRCSVQWTGWRPSLAA